VEDPSPIFELPPFGRGYLELVSILLQGPILQNSVSAKNCSGKFSSSNFGPISTQKKMYNFYSELWTIIIDFKVFKDI
jgi:hypothetical protein